jgi:hypothetical protein
MLALQLPISQQPTVGLHRGQRVEIAGRVCVEGQAEEWQALQVVTCSSTFWGMWCPREHAHRDAG